MAFGTRSFEIEQIRHHPGSENLTQATVVFNFDDEMPGGAVTQNVAVTVRLSVDESATIAELHESAYRKALEQIPRVLSLTEGRSASDLRTEVVAKSQREKEEIGYQPE